MYETSFMKILYISGILVISKISLSDAEKIANNIKTFNDLNAMNALILSNDNNNYIYTDIQDKNDIKDKISSKMKRSVNNVTDNDMEDTKNKSNQSNEVNTTEECIGDVQFCNMTKEDYIQMLNNYIYPQTYEWILISTHTAVFIMGLVGNALVCVAVYRNHSMRTVTNFFIVNLAVADFMVILFCLPATVLWDVTETWFLGDALCKTLLYFQV